MLCTENITLPIKVRIRDTNLTSYNIPVDNVENILGNDYLVFYIDPENYNSKPQYDDLDIYSFGVLPNLLSEVYTLNINIDYTEINLLEALNAICRNDFNNNRRTEILDYIRPNVYTDEYTTRLGTFNFLEIEYNGQYDIYRPQGLPLVFLELPVRYKSLIIEGTEYFVEDSNYKKLNVGEGSKLLIAGKGSYLKKSLFRCGFTAKLDYSDINIYRNILSITTNSLENTTPIVITDNLSPEGYTSRTGYIYPELNSTGIKLYPETSTEYLPQGFNIKFLETTLRYV